MRVSIYLETLLNQVFMSNIITRLNERVPLDQIKLQRLKKRKLTLKDEIKNLQSLILPDIIA